MRFRTAILACLGAALAVPLPATAASVSVAGSTLTYRGGNGPNDLTLSAAPGAFAVADASGVSAGAGCRSVSRTVATCAAGAVNAITVKGEGGSDALRAMVDGPAPVVTGAGGNDRIAVGNGGSRMSGQAGDDQVAGGDGPDRVSGGAGSDRLDAGAGADRVNGDAGGDVLSGGDGADILRGGGGDDGVQGGNEADRVEGGDGDDELDGGLGPDVFDGGGGRDTADYAVRTEPVLVDLDGNPDDGQVDEGDNVANDVEIVQGGSGADQLAAVASGRTLAGNAGDDALQGGRGADTLQGGEGDDALNGDLSDDELDGGPGADTADYTGRFDGVVLDLTRATATIQRGNPTGPRRTTERDRLRSIENGRGSSRPDELIGDAGPNVLESGSGDDKLSGGGGPDVLNGGAGRDTATYRARRTRVAVTLDDVANDGGAAEGDDVRSNVESVLGGAGPDALVGSARRNFLSGGPGADRLSGGAGSDRLLGGAGRDRVDAGPGRDLLLLRDGQRDLGRCSGPEDRPVVDRADRLEGCRRP